MTREPSVGPACTPYAARTRATRPVPSRSDRPTREPETNTTPSPPGIRRPPALWQLPGDKDAARIPSARAPPSAAVPASPRHSPHARRRWLQGDPLPHSGGAVVGQRLTSSMPAAGAGRRRWAGRGSTRTGWPNTSTRPRRRRRSPTRRRRRGRRRARRAE
jgi:hypothetical protein